MAGVPSGWQVLSVRQPYAHLLLSGIKEYECRTWCPSVLGAYFIHASASLATQAIHVPVIARALKAADVEDVDALPRGAIVGIVNFDTIIEPGDKKAYATVSRSQRLLCADDGDASDYYLWKVTAPTFLPPVKCKGKLGLWPLPSKVLKKLNGHL